MEVKHTAGGKNHRGVSESPVRDDIFVARVQRSGTRG